MPSKQLERYVNTRWNVRVGIPNSIVWLTIPLVLVLIITPEKWAWVDTVVAIVGVCGMAFIFLAHLRMRLEWSGSGRIIIQNPIRRVELLKSQVIRVHAKSLYGVACPIFEVEVEPGLRKRIAVMALPFHDVELLNLHVPIQFDA